MAKKKRQIRVDFRKSYEARTRDEADLTRKYDNSQRDEFDTVARQRVSGKGQWTRRRTITVEGGASESADGAQLDVDLEGTKRGTVLRVHGLDSIVLDESGQEYRCALRGLLKSVATDQRHVVVAGDRVYIRPESNQQGMIVRIEKRTSELARTSKEKRHVIAANIDQMLIVTSAAEPKIKPNLIDRLLATAEQGHIDACICINKCDLIDPTSLQSLVGTYAQMGYRVLMLSAQKGWNIDLLKKMMIGKSTVVVGQSGVGKSSLLNAIEEGLQQRVQTVSAENSKGRHTTTTAQVLPLKQGGAVIDTPGVRQFQLWDILREELSGLFRDIRPLSSKCRYPDCTHTHENDCFVKSAVADYRLDVRRYESYTQMRDDPTGQISGDADEAFE